MRVLSSHRVPFANARPATTAPASWSDDRPASVTAKLKAAFYGNLISPRERYARVVRRALRSGPLLDLGCGRDAPFLASCEADVLKVGIDRLVGDGSGHDRLNGDVTEIPLRDNSVEVACCRSVLEHLTDPKAFFAEVKRILRPGGTFVGLTPNRFDYVSVAASLVPNHLHGRVVAGLTERPEERTFPTFYRANTARAIRGCAAHAGLSLVSVRYLRAHPHYLQFSPLTYALGVLVEQVVERRVRPVRPWLLVVLVKEPSVMAPVETRARGAARPFSGARL